VPLARKVGFLEVNANTVNRAEGRKSMLASLLRGYDDTFILGVNYTDARLVYARHGTRNAGSDLN
jgi:hypothetical protein